jgi:hypothetical protein
MKLPFKRFVAQVSTGEPRPKSSYIALMAENLEALKACPWREAADIPVALADHDFTKASHFSDAYFRITADDGTPIFSIEKTDAMVVGANAAGITVGESSIVIPVPVVSPDPPTMYWRQHLDSGDWADESSPPAGATVTWTGEAGARVCTISFSGTRYNGQAQATALCRAGRPAVFLHARN